MATYYDPFFLWLPKRLTNGKWAWLRTVQRVRRGGYHTYRDYLNLPAPDALKGDAKP